ncbi:hypothetical protein DW650_15425 [Roseburia sp. AM23-20]|jgi:hypothetical protein|uniref:hypothetical protein n=1 Tax=Roseburia sp. AM23-20 TaxID=2292066 RepID=UPI000E490DD3|nr:hypothetical protein [Roseburia sp. AM23-20]RHF92387.1 hypothetical protein DW650_15425 [Roseburia sp. AM23-20]
MFIDENDIKVLEDDYIPNIRMLMKDKSVSDVLDMIDNIIIEDILDNDNEPSEVGRKLQLIYDRIQRDNE